ncbi:MAG: putative transrane protein [Verrucomicrobiales bacterium]|nr:putative transrane protein [Verrucomicrobiales bacterium]
MALVTGIYPMVNNTVRLLLHIPAPAQWNKVTLGLLAHMFWFLALAGTVNAASQVSKGYQIKAAFLYNFTKFVEWPPERFPDASSPIIIGIVGNNSFARELETIVKDRKVNGRAIIVKIVESAADASLAQVMFFNAGEENRRAWLLIPNQGIGVLTVGESESFVALGGMINFTMEGDKVRFEINIGVVEKEGLKLSAQLQKLAKTVRK